MKTYLEFMAEDTTATEGFYSFRPLNVQSATYLYEWMKENRIPNPIPTDKLHVTVVCSDNDVPSYMPDPTPLQISPATFRLDMMQEALVIKFKSDALEEQWQRSMNMGAKSRYQSFSPHISLSYKVPLDYDCDYIKPPPTFLVFDGEQMKPNDPNWAKKNGLREETAGDIISDNPGIYVPQLHLNVAREDLPQVTDRNKMDFVDWLEKQGILVQYLDVPVSLLRSVQNEIDLEKVQKLMNVPVNKPILISRGNYVIDGHHRWVAALNHDPHQLIPTYRINLPIQQCLERINSWHEHTSM